MKLFLAIVWSIALVLDIIRWAMDREQAQWRVVGRGPRWLDVFLPEGVLTMILWVDYLNSIG